MTGETTRQADGRQAEGRQGMASVQKISSLAELAVQARQSAGREAQGKLRLHRGGAAAGIGAVSGGESSAPQILRKEVVKEEKSVSRHRRTVMAESPWQRRVWAGPAVSLVVHLLLLVAVYGMYRPRGVPVPVNSVTMEMTEPEQPEEELCDEPDTSPETLPEPPLTREVHEPLEVTAIEETAQTAEALAVESMELPLTEMAETPSDFTRVQDIHGLRTSFKRPELYAGRSAAGRRHSAQTYSGRQGEAMEKSVQRALEWLKKTQNADGSWAPSQQPAMAGLCLLAFLAHGEDTGSAAYGGTVRRALQYLCAETERCGGVFGSRNTEPYVNGIVAYALSEAYGMTRLPVLKAPMEQLLGRIVAGQQAGGGFNYFYDDAGRWDVSLSAWQFQALRAGVVAGAEVPGMTKSLERGAAFLRRTAFRPGGRESYGKFGYTRAGVGSDGMQGAGALCLQLMGQGGCEEVRAAVAYIQEVMVNSASPRETRLHWDGEWKLKDGTSNPVYYWYYCTQAMFHAGGGAWKSWLGAFMPMAVAAQRPDGSWVSPGTQGKTRWKGDYDPWYTTALTALSLQVTYRYLPSARLERPSGSSSADELEKVDAELGL